MQPSSLQPRQLVVHDPVKQPCRSLVTLISSARQISFPVINSMYSFPITFFTFKTPTRLLGAPASGPGKDPAVTPWRARAKTMRSARAFPPPPPVSGHHRSDFPPGCRWWQSCFCVPVEIYRSSQRSYLRSHWRYNRYANQTKTSL